MEIALSTVRIHGGYGCYRIRRGRYFQTHR